MIPKKIHFIWIGKKDIKPEYSEYISSFKKLYIDYDVKMWNEDDINSKGIIPNNLRIYYDDDSLPIAFKADILRYLIINRYGGLYFDTDFAPLKKMPDYFLNFDFLGGIQNNGEIAIGFFAAKPNTDLLEKVLKLIPNSIEHAKLNGFYLPHEIHRITGPEFFNKIATEYIKENNYFFFTKEYFYPYWFTECERKTENFKTTSPLAYAVHHWRASWKC